MPDKLNSLLAEVSRRAQELVVPALFEKLKATHQGKGLRECECEYCQAKRVLTYTLMDMRSLPRDLRSQRRDLLRQRGATELLKLAEQ